MWHNFLCNLQWMKWCLSLTPFNAAPSSWELGPALHLLNYYRYLWDVFPTTLSVLLSSWRRVHEQDFIIMYKTYKQFSYCKTSLQNPGVDMIWCRCQCPWEITGTGAGAAICLTGDWGWLRQLARAIIEFPFVRVSFRLLGDCIQQAAMQHIYRDSRPLGSSIV